MKAQHDYWTSPSHRTGCRKAIEAGPNLWDGMADRRVTAPGPVPVRTSGLVAA